MAGCGSASATHTGTTATVNAHGSGSAAASVTARTTAARTTSTTTSAPPCAPTVMSTLGTVAERIYSEAAGGGIVAQAVNRLKSSAALASAVNRGDSAAAGAALRELMAGQIVRVEVLRGGHVLARAGSGVAIAPVHGTLSGTSATFVVSTQSAHSYLQVVHQVTGAQVLLFNGTHLLAGTLAGAPPASLPNTGALTYAGKSFQASTLSGTAFPSGPLRITLLVPTATISCSGTAAQTRVETLGHVGERIYREELNSPDVSATLRHIERSSAFQRAVAAHDAAAVRAAIVGFFGEHIHVVRVRVTTGGHLLEDLGGPYVLAPVRGTVRSGGRVVGQFEMAIQDDAGYLRLAHLFTGAEVLMRTGTRQVMGTLSPGPASVPARGPVSYGGRSYQAYSFTGEAFPSGPLRLSLLLAN